MHHQPKEINQLIKEFHSKTFFFTQNSLQLVIHVVKKCDFNDQIINNKLATMANIIVFVKCR